MLVCHRKPFFKGFILLLSFALMAVIMLMPIFKGNDGEKLTSLEFADAVFNSLSKGSSNFFDEVEQSVRTVAGQNVHLAVAVANSNLGTLAVKQLKDAGVDQASDENGVVAFAGDLAQILSAATRDSREIFNNNGQTVVERYGCANPLDCMQAWWRILEPSVKELQKAGRIADAKVVDAVVKKAVEPANNFYGISDANVADNILLILAMLTFYVIYAIWYGFGIYNLFDGLGLMGAHEKTPDAAEDL